MVRKKSELNKRARIEMTRESECLSLRFPKLRELYVRLLSGGGKYIHLDYQDAFYWIDRMINDGEWLYPEHVSYKISRKCNSKSFQCYQNLINITSRHTPKNTQIYIGYSLMTVENCWIQHVWLYDGETIYESTPIESSRYYGIPTDIGEFNLWMNNYRWKLPPDYGYHDMMK